MTRLFLGRKEEGKTTLMYYVAAKVPRRVIFESRGDIRRPGAHIAQSAETFMDGIARLHDGEITELVYTPNEPIRKAAFPFFSQEIKALIQAERRTGRPLAIVVDEIAQVDLLNDDFDWAWKCCAKSHQHFFFSCHRPVDVPVTVRALTDFWYVFPVVQEHDLAVLHERLSDAAVAAVERLGPHEFLIWDDGKHVFETRRDRTAWFTDLAPRRPVIGPVYLDLDILTDRPAGA